MERKQLIPGPDHPITVEPADVRVVVSAGSTVVADTAKALVLREASYPPAYYVPLADVDEAVLRPSQTQTYCPYKGDASYYSVAGPEGEITDAVWTYITPYDAVAEIAGYVAFYPDRVSITTK
ncbi:MAG: DUF427 domain-containing protein [Streptosporangiaceae bacterium]